VAPSRSGSDSGGLGLKLLRLVATGEASGLISEHVSEAAGTDVYVKTSPIHGLGVFARRTFATGEGVVFRNERPVTIEQPLDPARGEVEQHCVWTQGGRQLYLGFPARFVNHSCDPNAFVAERDGVSQIVALKPIRAHEEVVIHYGIDLSGATPWKCSCGSDRCLGVVAGDFFELPLDTQIELSPFLSPWFIREHDAAYRSFLEESGLSEEIPS
jgi:hypothetical protein